MLSINHLLYLSFYQFFGSVFVQGESLREVSERDLGGGDDLGDDLSPQQRHLQQQQHRATGYHSINCNINDNENVKCRKEGNEVFLPFSFIKRYFEVGEFFFLFNI